MELSAATLVFLSLLSLPILVTLLSRKPKSSPKNRQPPGPLNLPLIGSLHHFIKTNPQVALRDLANKYGPVMFLRMGQIDTVVISSTEAAQEVLREKDLTFASRPSIVASEIFCYGNTDIAFSPYGAYWRTLRKLCTVELLSAKMVRRLAPVRNDETLSLIRSVQAAGQGGKPVNLGRLLLSCSNIMAAKAAFGHVCSSELREQFLSGLHVGLQFTSGFTIGDVFPSLRFVEVISGRRRRMLRAHRQLDEVLDKIIAQCEALQGDSLVNVLLRIRDDEKLEFSMGRTNIKAIILVILFF
jgi:cytochrome P450